MNEILTASRVIGNDGNIRYDVQSEPTEYILGNKRRLNFMWDTGAFISVLSVANFVKNRDSEDYRRLEKSIDEDADYASVSLLGADFIDYCKYEHDIENDIIVNSFDNRKYSEYHNFYRYKGKDMVYTDLFAIDAV